MSRFLLVRHAPHGDVNRVLTGRKAGVGLGPEGRRAAARLAAGLGQRQVDAILTSPRERTLETARAIAEKHSGLAVQISEALDEVDFGRWTGRSFEELDADPLWRRWNEARSEVRAPGGETMAEVQARASTLIECLAHDSPEATFVLVTHAEVVRAVACRALGLSLDDWAQIEITPASVHLLTVTDGRLHFTAAN